MLGRITVVRSRPPYWSLCKLCWNQVLCYSSLQGVRGDGYRCVLLVWLAALPLATCLAQGVDVKPRPLAEIHQELRALERGTAKAESDAARSQNIAALCALFVEIGEHPQLPESPTLQSLSVRLRARLAGIERRTIDELRRRDVPEPEVMIEQRRAFQQSRVTGSQGLLGSSVGRNSKTPVGGASWWRAYEQRSSSDAASPGESQAEQGLAENARRPRGNAAPGNLPDYGWVLVDLIRKTIRPDYWSVAGGPGKAIYYGPSRALVIHGSWRIQEEVADLLTALRGGG